MKRKTQKLKNLTNDDYRNILRRYENAPRRNKISNPKKKALSILAGKFCRCIKKVKATGKNENEAIGICTNSVISSKGFKRGKFSCKKRKRIKIYKGGRKKKRKTRRKRGGLTEDEIQTKCLALSKKCMIDMNNKEYCDKKYISCVNNYKRSKGKETFLLGGHRKRTRRKRKKKRKNTRRNK